jgi:hypothetical protein
MPAATTSLITRARSQPSHAMLQIACANVVAAVEQVLLLQSFAEP